MRAAVVGGAGRGARHGWSVLARAGMAAWAAAVAALPAAPGPVAVPAPGPGAQPGAVSTQLVDVLAAMVLAIAAPG